MFQNDVPAATPDLLKEVRQVTEATAALSVAVPRIRMLADVTSTLVLAGEVILSVGATVSLAAVLVTASVLDANPPLPSRAVTVRRFSPGLSGIGPVDQTEVPEARPLGPRELIHSTRTMPAAGEAVPASVTVGERLT